MQSLSVYDLIILHGYFAAKKEPTDREKAVVEKLDKHLLLLTEGMQLIGPLPQ